MPPCLSFFISFPPETYRTPYWSQEERKGSERRSLISLVSPDLISLTSYSFHLVVQAVFQLLQHANILPTTETGLGQSSHLFFTWQIHLIERVHPSISSLKNSIPSLLFFSSLCIISNNHLWLNVSSPTGTQVQEIYMSYPTFLDPKGLEPCLECNRP